MKNIILASGSPRRRELLEQWGIPYKVMPSDVNEDIVELNGRTENKAQKLALVKALDVSKRLTEGLVLGADTIVVLNNEIFGKPKDENDAYNILKKLSGRCHEVITGVAVVNSKTGSYMTSFEKTRVFFRNLTDAQIWDYISTGEPMDKAGAYAIQEKGSAFVDRIEGSYTNVIGLPYELVVSMLKNFVE